MSNIWKNNNLLLKINEKEDFNFNEGIIYKGTDDNEYLYMGKRHTYQYNMAKSTADLALFGKTSGWSLGKGFEIDGFHTSSCPLNVSVKESKNEVDIFVTNMPYKPRIITNKAKQMINYSSPIRKASKSELKIANELINNSIRVSKLDDTPHIIYSTNNSNLLFFKKSLIQDTEGNIHSIRFNIDKIEFLMDGNPVDILDIPKIKDIKTKCDKKYMDDYKYGSSFLLSDMAGRYSEAEKEAFQSILNFINNNNYKLIDSIYYTTEYGDKSYTVSQIESAFFRK